jgi:hypothetical protein
MYLFFLKIGIIPLTATEKGQVVSGMKVPEGKSVKRFRGGAYR